MSICVALACIKMNGATCAELESSLSENTFVKGFYVDWSITLSQPVMKECQMCPVLSYMYMPCMWCAWEA